jgi:hypothetical protein
MAAGWKVVWKKFMASGRSGVKKLRVSEGAAALKVAKGV